MATPFETLRETFQQRRGIEKYIDQTNQQFDSCIAQALKQGNHELAEIHREVKTRYYRGGVMGIYWQFVKKKEYREYRN